MLDDDPLINFTLGAAYLAALFVLFLDLFIWRI